MFIDLLLFLRDITDKVPFYKWDKKVEFTPREILLMSSFIDLFKDDFLLLVLKTVCCSYDHSAPYLGEIFSVIKTYLNVNKAISLL